MQHWDLNKNTHIERPKNVNLFLQEIEAVCEKYNIYISYEDGHGSFILTNNKSINIQWLNEASLDL